MVAGVFEATDGGGGKSFHGSRLLDPPKLAGSGGNTSVGGG